MITSNIPSLSSTSAIKAKVDIYTKDSALIKSCTCGDVLEDFKVYREGENHKFFGFGVSHKVDINLIDFDNELEYLKTDGTVEIGFGDGGEVWDEPYPTLYIKEVRRDRKASTISCTAYDKLYFAGKYTVNDLTFPTAPYSLGQLAAAVADKLGLVMYIDGSSDPFHDITFDTRANLEGTEDLRSLLNWIAEISQTIYFIDYRNRLVFKKLYNAQDTFIRKSDYYELTTQPGVRLEAICHVTELGNNIEVLNPNANGNVKQYIRNNPLLESKDDETIAAILLEYMALPYSQTYAETSFTPFECEWTGNYLLEIGDCITVTTKQTAQSSSGASTFLINDVLYYSGIIEETSSWSFDPEHEDIATNPSTLGDKLNMTSAKVDKVNKEVTLLVSDATEAKESLSRLQLTTTEINAQVSSVEQKVIELETSAEDNAELTNTRIDTLTKDVNLKLDKEGVEITVENKLAEGVEKVVTASKKYTFDDTGLNVSSADSEISTRVTEDGMRIYKQSKEVLTVDNTGVKAADLHATTFLLIGENSRLEDRGRRTACFWIGPIGG